MDKIPCLRSLLPNQHAIIRYLQRIDEKRQYSNFGPLVLELEHRLAVRYGVSQAEVTTVANATVGLTAVLRALDIPTGSLCAMPAWTFVASPEAAQCAGLVPWFLDVQETDWALSPAIVEGALARMPSTQRLGAVMPVAPFGQPLDLSGWEEFQRRTGIPVIVDAAAAFDSLQATHLPCVVSLHATKILGCGEGGFIMSRDTALLRRVRAGTTFGFSGSREAVVPGSNAKMSEYAAAVGLAALDGWSTTRDAFLSRAATYASEFFGSKAVKLQVGFGISWISATCCVRLPEGSAPAVAAALGAIGAEARHWWGRGAHEHFLTRLWPREPLPVTTLLASSTIGLPFFVDISDASVRRVAQTVVGVL
jgi:dTDP-4-amino-4,6-dideoxygalactose transaminase